MLPDLPRFRTPQALHRRITWLGSTRFFGPVRSMLKAASMVGLKPDKGLMFRTQDVFWFDPLNSDIQLVQLLVKRQSLHQACRYTFLFYYVTFDQSN